MREWPKDIREIFATMRPPRTLVRLALLSALVSNPSSIRAQTCHDQWPAWSPDGGTVVFVSTHTGDHEVYSVSVASGALRRLTDSPGRDAHPSFSPDGTRIAFQSPRRGEGTDLYIMNGDGTGVRRVTALGGFAGMPVWSPRGDRLAFQHRAAEAGSLWNIMTVDVASGRVRTLTTGATDDQVVNWAPGGDRMTFHSNRTGVTQVYLWEDGRVRPLTEGPAEHRTAAWSPDGSSLALRTSLGGESGFYLVRLDGSDPVPLGGPSVEHGVPFFSPAGDRILITPTSEAGTRIRILDLATGSVSPVLGPCDAR